MKRPLFIAFAALLCACLLGFLIFGKSANPAYHGKRLSVWLKESEQANRTSSPATAALRHFGHDAEPLLSAMLQAQDSSISGKLKQLLQRQSLVKFHFETADAVNLRALHACSVLGPEASGTVPAITALLEQRYRGGVNYPNGRPAYEFALGMLAHMGPDGIKGLVRELDSNNINIRVRTAELLGTAPGTGAPEVIAALQKTAADAGDSRLRDAASHSLELIQKRQAQHIPASATNWVESPASGGAESPSVWDISHGTRVLATSGLEQGQGTWHPEDVFGTRLSRVISGETGSIVFDNSHPDGFTHFIEWESPQLVRLSSFGFVAGHDSSDGGFQRAIRTFRLYARATEADQFKLIYGEELSVPYGIGYRFDMLLLFRNLDAPVTARQFRAEFVQNGVGPWHGPRAMQLYGFPAPLSRPMVRTALQNQTSDVQEEARRYFGK